MIKAVFLDLDETLVDSIIPHLKADRLVFEKFGYDYDLIEEKVKGIDFMGTRVSDVLITKRNNSDITENELSASKLIEARENIFLGLVKNETTVYPGVISLLKILKKLNKTVAIVSSGSKKYINMVLNKFCLNSYIDFIISGDQVEKGKPNPECYLKAYKYINKKYKKFKKSECLVIEDTENGVIAGSKAGLKILLVPSKYSVLPKTIKPDYQLKTLEDFDATIHLI
jgi:HAD superfamily hydrolase (TIGR01509 family)